MKIKYSSNVMYGMTKLDCKECIHVIKSIKDNKKNGEQKQWDKNGLLFIQKYYINDIQEGEYKEWFSNGQLFKQICYHNGKIDGAVKRWHASGQVRIQGYYKNDRLDGEVTLWHYRGKIWEQQYYDNGKESIEHKEIFNEDDRELLNIYNEEHDKEKIMI